MIIDMDVYDYDDDYDDFYPEVVIYEEDYLCDCVNFCVCSRE